MPVEALQRSSRQPAKAAAGAPLPRLRAKGPLGLEFYKKPPAGTPRQSAVERLEADKVKYVKSQVALTKQQPVRAPELKKPLLNPSTPLRPTRKTPAPAHVKQEGVQLDLEHLSSLISDLPDQPHAGATAGSGGDEGPDGGTVPHGSPSKPPTRTPPPVKERPRPPPRPDWSSPAKVRLKAPGPAKVDGQGSPGAPVAGTVRRVDVIPQAGPVRSPSRPPQYQRQPLQPLHFQFPLRPAASRQRLFIQAITPGPSPLKPPVAPKPEKGLRPSAEPAAPALHASPPPPPSPAVTRLSSSSSRKRPSLTRSKSDMSDRYSRAGTELERFFNLCGLEPSDLQELQASSSDIVSLARFRSVSAPGSECCASNQGGADEEENEDEAAKATDRVPYGVSVIERNARVIKWLYGLRQAKENTTKSTNL